MEDLSPKHEGPKRAYWPTRHARDPAMKARVMCKTENILLFEGQHGDSREVEAETGGSLVEDGRRDCCSSVSGSGLYESPVSTSACSLIFVMGGDDGGLEQRLHYERIFQKCAL